MMAFTIVFPPKCPHDDFYWAGINFWPILKAGETFMEHSWEIPKGLIFKKSSIDKALAVITLAGGVDKQKYTLRFNATTNQGRHITKTAILHVDDQYCDGEVAHGIWLPNNR